MTTTQLSLEDLHLPAAADWSGLSETMEQFRAELARYDAFTKEWTAESDALQELWSELHDDLTASESDLATRESTLAQQQRELEQERDRYRQSATELAQVRTDLQVYRNRVAEIEQERNACQEQRDAIAEEMSTVADLIELVKSTQDELSAAREETVHRRQQQWEECQQAARSEVVRLQSRNNELEQELLDLRGSTETLSERLRHQDDELQGYRTRWNTELGKLQTLFAKRSSLLDGPPPQKMAVIRDRSGEAVVAKPEVSRTAVLAPDHVPPRPAAEEAPVASTAAVASTPATEPPPAVPESPPTSSDPVVGSVLAAFARLGRNSTS